MGLHVRHIFDFDSFIFCVRLPDDKQLEILVTLPILWRQSVFYNMDISLRNSLTRPQLFCRTVAMKVFTFMHYAQTN